MRQDEAEVAVVVVAGGRGMRAAVGDAPPLPKQYRLLAGRPVLARTLDAFIASPAVALIQTVIGVEDRERYNTAISTCLTPKASARLLPPAVGGTTRQGSVRAGLEALAAAGFSGIVLVHDAARPFVSEALLARAVAAGGTHRAAIPVTPLADTVKRLDASGCVVETPPRAELGAVQTPQVFAFADLLAAHRRAADAGRDDFTDDAAVMEWAGENVATFVGDRGNVKLTHPEDFALAEERLTPPMSPRVGQGYDVHRFGEGDHVWLGGVRIPHDRGVIAHSDGDVVLHALTDALLGALAEDDIGVHFKPSDPRWRGAASDQFLAFAVERVRARGGRIDHLDTTVVCETPKVGPHRAAIRARIADIARLPLDRVSIKATTSERMGFTGRGEGLAALAMATVVLPVEPVR